jgi:hypothetical protein
MKYSKLASLISEFKSSGKGLMTETQYNFAAQEINKIQPCNLLIFGLGEDALIWQNINSRGRTIFIEDDKDWIQEFVDTDLEIYNVSYNTRAEDHKNINFDLQLLEMNLPKEVTSMSWDIIFVDGPLGHNPPRPYKGPGRMKSIYAAYTLLKTGGVCIIDDMGRSIESRYSFHFFGENNMYQLIEDKLGFFKKVSYE